MAHDKAESEASFADDKGSSAPHVPWEVNDEDKDLLSSGAVLSGAASGSGSARVCRGLVEGAFGDTTALGRAAQSLSGHQMRCGSSTLHRRRVAAHLSQRAREQCFYQLDAAERLSAVPSPDVHACSVSQGCGVMTTACLTL